jgi:DNA invertase Pin-like site-specific DNA recombinase
MKQNSHRPIRTAVYTRSATDNGLDAQQDAINELIAIRKRQGENWTVTHRLVDARKSGITTDRPAYQKLLKLVRSGKIDAVAIERVDRISRLVDAYIAFAKELGEHDVKLVSREGVRDPIAYRRKAEKRRIC